jgi:hypothetical protein
MRLLLNRTQEVQNGNREYVLDYHVELTSRERQLLADYHIALLFMRADLEPMLSAVQHERFASLRDAQRFEAELRQLWNNIADYVIDTQEWQGNDEKEYFFEEDD